MKSFFDMQAHADKTADHSEVETWDKKGVFFTRKQAILIIIGMIGMIIVVGVLAGTLGRKCTIKDTKKIEKDTELKPSKSKKRNVRLPGDVIPVNYQIKLHPQFEPNFIFEGEVRIQISCLKQTEKIILHSVELNISSIEIGSDEVKNERDAQIQSWEEDIDLQFLIIKLTKPIKENNVYFLTIVFVGNLTDSLAGLYRSSYKDANGILRWLAVTQFEPTDARKAFPCFDEPAMKATFETILVRKNDAMSLSNMEIKQYVERSDGWTEDHYYTSVRMSTYLLAFVICKFEHKEKITSSGVTFRVWSRPEVLQQTDYALKVGVTILEFYENFFNISFPLNKTDMIAIPDFSAGAMENWGLITFRETAMLFDPVQSSSSNKQRVAVVVAHELAHQWFGNLVSPAWWDDLWLNEGFASYMEYLGVHAAEPEWKMHEQFITEDLHIVLSADAVKSSHPISLPVYEPDEINEIFDSISYGKGAAVIRMMRYFLGDQVFRKGLTTYLNSLKYGNAATDDLWNSFTEVAHLQSVDINVKDVMDTWTRQMGYPVITVTRDYKKNQTQIIQNRFLLDPNVTLLNDKEYKHLGYVWEVPITYTTARERNWDNPPQMWLHKDNKTLNQLLAPSSSWIIANILQTGFYRVNYDTNNWELLIQQLLTDHNKITPINRAQIIDDAFNLARAGLLDYSIALNTTLYLDKERDYLAWQTAFKVFDYIDDMLSRNGRYGLFANYLLKKLTPLYIYVGWDDKTGETHLDVIIRTAVITHACDLGMEHCVLTAQHIYDKFMDNSSYSIPGNRRAAVYCTAIRYGATKEWQFSWDRYLNESTPTERSKLISAMACSRDTWILNRYLESPFISDAIRKQDAGYIVKYVAQNPSGRYLVWSYFVTNWKKIKERYGSAFFMISNYIKSSTLGFNTAFETNQIQDFLQLHKNELGAGENTFYEQLERAMANKKWMDKNLDSILAWLEANG